MSGQLTEIEFRNQHRLQAEVKARLERLDAHRLRLSYRGISTWTTFDPVDGWDVPTVRFYLARRRAFAEWNPVTGKASSIGQEPPFKFTTKNANVLVGRVMQMANRLSEAGRHSGKIFPNQDAHERGDASPQGSGHGRNQRQGA